MVVIKLQGGLGNQMFQYAFANIVAKKNNKTVLIDKSFFKKKEKKHGFTPRNFELAAFNNFHISAAVSDIQLFYKLSFINKLKKRGGLDYPKIYTESSLNFHQNAVDIKTPVYIKGYFQSYKYFLGNENFVRQLFSFPVDTLDTVNREILLKIKNTTAISIHVRRGDYVEDSLTQQFHGNCSLNYYLEAIALLASKNKDFTLFFFSDDSPWVKEQFNDLPYSKIFIDNNKNENSWKDMMLMSSCNHNIIANSSFSWWAAWLNINPEKTVIAPKSWFADSDRDTTDLIPSQWIRL